MGRIRTFCDLVAWQKAMDLACMIYAETEAMPRREQYELTSQMRSAAVSIPSNIAEGYARQTLLEYLRFLRIARGSLAEVSTQLELATRLNMLKPSTDLLNLVAEEARILHFLIEKLEAKRDQRRH